MEIIENLLKNGDFNEILNAYGLYKYELLDIISSEILPYPVNVSQEEADILKKIYISEAIMFNLSSEKVMLISDTHIENKRFECLDYLSYVYSFCKLNQIHYLIHCGDIADGTDIKSGKSLGFSEFRGNEAIEQSKRIVEKYFTVPSITQFILCGNHDLRYLQHQNKVDILRLLAQYKNIYPLGFIQAFFSIFGQTISLEHSNNRIYEADLISHSFAIKGHSHLWSPLKDRIYIPTLSNYIFHKGKEEGKPGFVVMQAIQTLDDILLQFDRYSFTASINPVEALKTDEKTYSLVRKKSS